MSLNVREIDYEEYCLLEEINRNDPYLQCKSIQEQRMYDFTDRVVYEECKDYRLDKYEINHEVYVGKERIKSPKKYSRLSSYLMSNNYLRMSLNTLMSPMIYLLDNIFLTELQIH